MLSRLRFLVLVVLVVGATGAGAAHAQSLDPPVGAPGEYVESWALSPVGENPGDSSTRPNFTYTLPPGGTVEDGVTLWNYSSRPVRFRLLATDAFNNETGDFSLLSSGKRPRDVGTWISLGTSTITVPARTSATIPVIVRVPPDASPGDHTGAILAASDTVAVDDAGNQVTLDRRTGPRVYIRVSGPVNPELVLEDLSAKYRGRVNPFDGSLDVTYTVRNPGNVRLGARPELTVTDLFGRTVARKALAPIDELLPGNAVTYTASVDGVPATIRVKATVRLQPASPASTGGDADVPVSAASVTAWAIPWLLLLILVLAYAGWRLWRRWRAAGEEDPPPAAGPAERVPEPALQ